MMKLKFEIKHALFLPALCLVLSLASCGGGGGGSSSGAATNAGDDGFFLEEAFFGRPLFDIDDFDIPIIVFKLLIEY